MNKQDNLSSTINYQPYYNKHYIMIDSSNNIVSGWSDGPHPEQDISKAICINEQSEYQFRPFPEREENPALFDNNFLPLYRYEDGEIIKKTKAELRVENALKLNRQLSSIKLQLIEKSKNELKVYLENHPLKWIDGKYYSVTQEKQALLTQQIAIYSLDPTTTLYWNASGAKCSEWSIEQLSLLAKAIADYVRPFVRYQQQKESEINSAETADEALEIQVDYSTLS